jgi:hypothetical protein
MWSGQTGREQRGQSPTAVAEQAAQRRTSCAWAGTPEG